MEERTRKLAEHKSQALDSHKQLACALGDLQESAPSVDVIGKMKLLINGLNRSDQKVLHDHASHLLLNFLVWDWVERMVMESTDNSSIGRLRQEIEKGWTQRPTTLSLDASDFLPGIPKGELTHSLSLPRQANYIPKPLFFHELALPVVANTWFGIPTTRTKAFYVRAILKSPLGIDAFYLEPLVMAASNLKRNVFGIGRNSNINVDMMENFANELCKHPICQRGSGQGSIVSSIIAHSQSAFPLDEALVDMVAAAQAPWILPLKYGSSKLSSLVVQPLPRDMLASMIKGLDPFLSPDFSCPPESALEVSKTPQEKEAIFHRRFLRCVHASSDKLLPFRNLAVSRRRILQPGGPYAPEHIGTKQGFFSALIYRGVTHNTQFLQEHKTFFTSLDDWTATYDPLCAAGKKKEYFCNVSAYGQPISAREVGNVAKYWEAIQNEINTSWLTAKEKIDPYDLFRLIKKFHGFGPLTAFQLTMDYVEGGKTEELTVDHMAKFICIVNAGGIKGLQIMGHEVSKDDQAGVAKALVAFQEHFIRIVPEHKRQKMGFGLILMEHTLCKLCRMTFPSFREWSKIATAFTLSY